MITNPNATRILCYGDSNTWGDRTILAVNERWTGVLQQILGQKADIIEEGMCARTTNLDDTFDRNGLTYFYPCLKSHNPLDGIIIMLGTNDLKVKFGEPSAARVASGLQAYTDAITKCARNSSGETPKVLFVSPIHIVGGTPVFDELYADDFTQASISVSAQLAPEIKKLAATSNSLFLDAATVASAGDDGLHINKSGHKALGEAIAKTIRDWIHV
ncbi:MAG TPA: GDSL-type esterase/lipase family protein [Candidatus Saccharimonas sp.]|nr:GDSL-type esterase/lipase family protein [Candidatus Saccharimonas sp.]